MSNIEKIRQEIERLKKCSESAKMEWIDNGYNQNAFAEDCRQKSFDHLLSFIDSLPEEDLYAEVGDTEEDYIKRSMAKVNECREMICKESLQVQETSKENTDSFTDDLEEAAEDCVWKSIDNNDPTLVPKFIPLLLSLFISGAYWQKEQMLKDAVDYKIVNNLAAYPVIYYEVNHLGLKYGDKVKIIIVKQ